MSKTQPAFQAIDIAHPAVPGDDHASFLKKLAAPTWLTIKGRDSSRRRVIVTLLHGNEPSGLRAIHHLLQEKITPATDLAIAIAGVDAALHEPLFSHRYIPGEKDLNRCFGAGSTSQHALCSALLELIHDFSPEAVVDTHNTSSHSEAFAVAVRRAPATSALAGMFTDTVIVMDQKLDTLLEYLDPGIPAVTVEYGGFMDPNADWLARETLHRFVVSAELPGPETVSLNLLEHPFRLETEQHLMVTYRSSIDTDADLTVINTIDQLNFRQVPPGTILGWFRNEHHRNLVAHDASGTDCYLEFFSQEEGQLRNRVPMTLFMATTDPVVANTDCLLYFVPTP